MPPSLTPNERFLADFHDQRAGVTAEAFGALPATKGNSVAASSYQFLAALVPRERSPLTVVDVACGDGYLLWLVASRRLQRATLLGVDISQGELAAGRRRLGARAAFLRGRAQAMPLADGSADIVLCHMALMLMDDPDSVLAEFRRVLRPGGLLSFIVGGKPSPSAAQDLYLSRLRAVWHRSTWRAPRLGDRRLEDPEAMQRLLSPWFDGVRVEALSISRRYEPSAMWSWFEGMYDLHGVPSDQQALMKKDYIEALTPICDEDGCIEFIDHLLQVSAVAT
jgi:ubiquinone/menaquinone biosynthesis C-methylase UbiE